MQGLEYRNQIFINTEVKMELIAQWVPGLRKPSDKTKSMSSISGAFYLLNFSHEVVNLSYCLSLTIARARLLGVDLQLFTIRDWKQSFLNFMFWSLLKILLN